MTDTFAAIALINPKTPANIGSVFRAADCFNANMVILVGPRPQKLAHLCTDTMKAHRRIPTQYLDRSIDVLTVNPKWPRIAVELLPDAKPLPDFHHPSHALYIFGPEDSGVSISVASECEHKIYIPTNRCLNLAMCVNIVLYDRMAKGTR